MDYAECAQTTKALSDETRLKIVDMLSCGELCACNLLEHLEISQPTLSYHMKALCSCGLVICDKRGSWAHYSLNKDKFEELTGYLARLSNEKEDCICRNSTCSSKESGSTCSAKKPESACSTKKLEGVCSAK